jgi:hypothetical protein
MRIPDGMEAACRKAAAAAVDFLLEVASDYRGVDAQAGMLELTALLAGQREAVVAGAMAKAFQAMAESLDPGMFQVGGDVASDPVGSDVKYQPKEGGDGAGRQR